MILDMMEALRDQIQEHLCGTGNPVVITNLQVTAEMNPHPTPPSIDIYPSTPFVEVVAYGREKQYWLHVRARVTTADNVAGQQLLLKMMDDTQSESVENAIAAQDTYAGATLGNIEGPTEYVAYEDTGGPENLLGTSWRVALIP